MPYETKENTGALFQPRSTQRLSFIGRVDFEGDQREIAIITVEDRDGVKHRLIFQKVGKLFDNEKKSEASPPYGGPISTSMHRLSCWVNRTKDDSPYLGVKVSERRPNGPTDPGRRRPDDDPPTYGERELARSIEDDDIPF